MGSGRFRVGNSVGYRRGQGRQAMFPLTARPAVLQRICNGAVGGPGVSPRDLSLILGAVAGLAGRRGRGLVAGRRHWDRTFLQYFLALGAGFMLAVAFLRMVPESLEKGHSTSTYSSATSWCTSPSTR